MLSSSLKTAAGKERGGKKEERERGRETWRKVETERGRDNGKGWDVHDMFVVPVLMWLVLWKF